MKHKLTKQTIIIFLCIVLTIILLIPRHFYNETFISTTTGNMKKDILFLLRSYNRPEYLEKTLQYLDNSDINRYCNDKYIYDDASNNEDTQKILDNYKDTYNVLFNIVNHKQKSFVKFMEYVENIDTNRFNFICYLDNDALVTTNFINTCKETFRLIKKEQGKKNNEIILTGFNTSNHPTIKSYGVYHLKKSIGGIHMFFHKSLLSDIKKWWDKKKDWGVVEEFTKIGGSLYCTNPSIVQHIGKIGDNSNGVTYDKSEIIL